jgi:hypothetical protein
MESQKPQLMLYREIEQAGPFNDFRVEYGIQNTYKME